MSYWNIPEPNLVPPDDGDAGLYICPECGEVLSFEDKVYRDKQWNIIGCCYCVEEEDAGDVLEDQNARYEDEYERED